MVRVTQSASLLPPLPVWHALFAREIGRGSDLRCILENISNRITHSSRTGLIPRALLFYHYKVLGGV